MKCFIVCFVIFLALGIASCDDKKKKQKPKILELTDRDFEEKALAKWPRRFVMFHAPWCENCKRLMPHWTALSKRVAKDKKLRKRVQLATLDCQEYESLCRNLDIMGFPTVLYFHKSPVNKERVLYRGKRDEETFFKYLKKVSEYDTLEELVVSPYISPKATSLRDGPKADCAINTMLKTHKSQAYFILFTVEPKMQQVWDKMAVEYSVERDTVQFLFVTCPVEADNDSYCQEYGPKNGESYTMQWFRGENHLVKYTGPPLLFDMRYFLEVVTDGNSMDLNGKLSGEARKILKERYDSKNSNFHEGILDLTVADFQATIKNGKTFVFFYIPWCKYSQEFSTTFTIAALQFLDNANVAFARVNCLEHSILCNQLKLSSWPSIIWYQNGKPLALDAKKRKLDDVTKFVSKMISATDDVFKEEQDKIFQDALKKIKESQHANIPALTEANFLEFIETPEKTFSFVLFHSPFCEHCKKTQPFWAELADLHEDDNVEENGRVLKIAQVDCFQWAELCNVKYSIERFPEYILFGPGGEELGRFDGKRSVEGWEKFVANIIGDGTITPKKPKNAPKAPNVQGIVWDEERMKEVKEKIEENMAKREDEDRAKDEL